MRCCGGLNSELRVLYALSDKVNQGLFIINRLRDAPNTSNETGRKEQSSNLRDTKPPSFSFSPLLLFPSEAVPVMPLGLEEPKALPINSTDFLSSGFCERSRNWRDFA